MYYSFACPKCGTLLTQFEDGNDQNWDANYALEVLVKQHFSQMHSSEEQTMTDDELLYAIKTGMTSSDERPY